MSIVTTAAAVPSRLFSIYAVLAESENGESRERIEALATPPSLATRGGEDNEASSSLFTTALQEARRIGLVDESEGRLHVSAAARKARKKGADREIEFRTYMINVLFDPDRAAEAGQGAFMLALSWLLSKNPLQPLSFSQAPQDMLRRDVGDQMDRTDLTNLNRYQNFLYWARYLGFATIVGDGSERRVVPDPTHAILQALPMIFGNASTLEIERFLAELSAVFPVFEGGAVRAEMERMRTAQSPDDERLSIATSLALQRLAERGEITLESVADARPRILDFGVGVLRVSRVRRGRSQ